MEADVQPVLLIYPPWPSDCPARGVLFAEFCHAHSKERTVDYFVTDESWQRIVDGLSRAGKVEPDRSRLQLKWEPLIHAERN